MQKCAVFDLTDGRKGHSMKEWKSCVGEENAKISYLNLLTALYLHALKYYSFLCMFVLSVMLKMESREGEREF